MPLVDELTTFVHRYCNSFQKPWDYLRERVQGRVDRQTYLVRRTAAGALCGYLDYDLTHDGILHVRKVIALQPGLLRGLVREVKTTVPWRRVYFWRAKWQSWRHHRRVGGVA
mgnify:CR=1 FL=1